MTRRRDVYRYVISFDVAQLNLVSRLMARTGLNLVSVIRLALATLADKLGEPVTLPRAGDTPQKQPGTVHEVAKRAIESRSTDSDPELKLDF